MKLTHPTMLAGAAVLLVLCGAWLHSGAVARRSAELGALQAEAVALRTALATAPPTASAHAQLLARSERQRAALPVGDDLADVLGPLAQDLTELTLADRSMVTNPAEPGETIKRIPLLVNFHSTFPAAFELMERMQGYNRIVRVRQLVISRPAESNGDTVSVSARFVTFARSTGEDW
jgi:hypothetical protein